MKVYTYTRARGFHFLDETAATLFLKEAVRGGGVLPCLSSDNARLAKHPITGRPVAYSIAAGIAVTPISGAASAVSTTAGVTLSWPSAVENLYTVERSVESGNGYPTLSFYPVTVAPMSGINLKDRVLDVGESARYRIYRVGTGGALTLHAELDVTQVSYGAGDALITITSGSSGYSNSTAATVAASNIIENKVFYTNVGQHGVNFTSGGQNGRFLFRNCVFIGSGNGITVGSGGGVPLIEIENCLFIGRKPGAGNANKSVGQVVNAGYIRYFRFQNCTVRNMGGVYLGAYRGLDTNSPIIFSGNFFWNVNRRRVDASGNYILSDWTSYDEDSSNPGFTKPSNPNTSGLVEPVGRDLCNCLQINQADNISGYNHVFVIGGMEMRANLYIGEPGKSSMEDAFNFYLAGGESLSKRLHVYGWCCLNNPPYDYNWVPGQPYNNGKILNSQGHGPPGQSQSGGLLSDHSPDSSTVYNYNHIGSYVLLEDSWHIGIGCLPSIQAGHYHEIRRARVIGSTLAFNGTYTSISGTSKSNLQVTKYDSRNATDNGLPLWSNNTVNGYRGIVPDSFNIGTRNTTTNTYPFGVDDKDIDLVNSSDNSAEKRSASIVEQWQGLKDFHAFCYATFGTTRLGNVPA